MRRYEDDRQWSDRLFRGVVWPRISAEWPMFIGSRLIGEKEEGEIKEQLDWTSNTDFIVKSAMGLIFVASRVQKILGHHTFTIRSSRSSGAKTELAKMTQAQENGLVKATYCVQAYVDPVTEELINAYGISTDDLLKCRQHAEEKQVRDDGNRFIAIQVNDAIRNGYTVYRSTYKTPQAYLDARKQYWKDRADYWAGTRSSLPPQSMQSKNHPKENDSDLKQGRFDW